MLFLFPIYSYSQLYHSLLNPSLGTENIYYANRTLVLNYPCLSTVECTPYILSLPKGTYRVEAYGSAGGSTNSFTGGKGGYASGTFSIYERTTVYAYIGGMGNFNYERTSNCHVLGGYNGGGSGYYESEYYFGSSGGGSTDLRLRKNDVFSRIIVAGSGGGASRYFNGGSGGGKEGENGKATSYDDVYKCLNEGGKQDTFGRRADVGAAKEKFTADAGFGYGGYFNRYFSSGWASGGGGSGWFGGSSGCVFASSGSGGSSYVFTEGSWRNDSIKIPLSYEMKDVEIYSGKDEQYGQTGNGKMIIHFIESDLRFRGFFISCNIAHEHSSFMYYSWIIFIC